MRAIDLFAGAGGWDEGIVPLGIRPLGIEWDSDACATREARGHPTVFADIVALDPLDYGPCDLLIASPPCQAFSAAGKRGGDTDLPVIYACLRDLANGVDRRAEHRMRCQDERSLLVVEPLRWALSLSPMFVALEQVPPVLDLWRWIAHEFAKIGYHTWVGLLSAERYGVPQTRDRAFLMASSAGPVAPPVPTHQEYRPGVPAAEQHTLEGTLLPWVSMAEALSWGMTERPTVTVTAGGDGGCGARATVERERERGRIVAYTLHRGAGMTERHGERPNTPVSQPAPVITSKARTATWYTSSPGDHEQGAYRDLVYVNGNQQRAARRHATDPAPTIHFGAAMNAVHWYDRGQGHTDPGEQRRMVRRIPDSEPAPTIGAAGLASGRDVWVWPLETPATTVAADPRLTSRSHHKHGEQGRGAVGRDEIESGSYDGRGPVRVTLEEAAILQGFPADYPFQGSRTAKFTQVGNAVPPPLARAVIEALIGDDRNPE